MNEIDEKLSKIESAILQRNQPSTIFERTVEESK